MLSTLQRRSPLKKLTIPITEQEIFFILDKNMLKKWVNILKIKLVILPILPVAGFCPIPVRPPLAKSPSKSPFDLKQCVLNAKTTFSCWYYSTFGALMKKTTRRFINIPMEDFHTGKTVPYQYYELYNHRR